MTLGKVNMIGPATCRSADLESYLFGPMNYAFAALPATKSTTDVVTGGMQSSINENTPYDDLPANLTPREAASWCRYRDRDSFLATSRATGLRVIHLNARVLQIDKQELRKWRDRRTA